jgi:energy-coupling factor transporter ATP-binding protein EcfA2
VTSSYPHAEEPPLRDVSVDVAAGEFVVAAGLSASGKSTVLRAACGLVPHVHGGDLEWAAERAPALATAGARLFARAGLRPPSSGVKEARATLRALLIEPGEAPPAGGGRRTPEPGRQRRGWRRGAWCLPRPRRGPRKGGAGGAAGGARVPRCLARALRRPCGSARSTFLADRVGDEFDAGGLERAGLTALAGRHPRDLSGGERRASRSRSSARPTRRPPRCASTSPRRHDRAAKGASRPTCAPTRQPATPCSSPRTTPSSPRSPPTA